MSIHDELVTQFETYVAESARFEQKGIKASAARARKVAAIRSFYKYLSTKAKLINTNPVQNLDSPQIKKTLPKYLNVEESISLLDAVDGKNQLRDYCILTLFLNCGLRISELIGLNITDIHGENEYLHAKEVSECLFTGKVSNLTDQEIETVFKGVPTFSYKNIPL